MGIAMVIHLCIEWNMTSCMGIPNNGLRNGESPIKTQAAEDSPMPIGLTRLLTLDETRAPAASLITLIERNTES